MDQLEKEWYQYLLDYSQKLFIGKIAPVFKHETITLPDIYIDLHALTDKKIGIGRYIANSSFTSESEVSFVFSLEQKITESSNNKIVIVGELGCGKTCLLNHFSIIMAQHKITQERCDNTFISKYYNRFVISVTLKDVENVISEENCIKNIIEAAIEQLVDQSLSVKIKEKIDQYSSNGILLLLDGYDEISEKSRNNLVCAINDFCKNKKNITIITSRTYAYEHSSLFTNNFECIKIAPFNKEQISKFVHGWIENCSTFYNATTSDKDIKSEQIIKEIFEKQYLMDLATNPLFLTLLLLLYIENFDDNNTQKFPVGRIRLYEEIVSLLLNRWNDGIDSSITREILEEVAYRDILKNEKQQSDIYPELCGIINLKFPNQISDIINKISERTGIIINTGNNYYSFIHRSFQEYLSAGYIIHNLDSASFLEKSLSDYLRWKEVDTFIIGKIGLEKYQTAISLLYYFVYEDYDKNTSISIVTLLMAAHSLVELLQQNTNMCFEDAKSKRINQRIKTWLKHYMSNSSIDYHDRFEFGNILAILGDDRKGIGIKQKEKLLIPDIDWIKIPEGNVMLGSNDNPINPRRNVHLFNYYISKYPITNTQFSAFVASKGYDNHRYWTKEGWNWVQGTDIPYLQKSEINRYPEDRENRYNDWLKARMVKYRQNPFWWHEEPWNLPNRPVVGITWYEAVAYCKWLNDDCIFNEICKLLKISSSSYKIALPTVEEWEKAACGPKNFKYPWGNILKKKCIKANIDVSQLNQTCAVGTFIEGKSGYGVFDVAGNVYEWIETGIIKDELGEYKIASNSDLNESIERMVKGGAWNFEYERTECASDDWDYPLIFDQNTGFRPVIRFVSE